MMSLRFSPAILVALLALASCGDPKPPPGGAPSTPSALPPSYALTTEPSGALDVLKAKAAVKNGDPVVVVGRVGGGKSVFGDTRAIFTIVDPSLKPCGEDGMVDPCPYPWDYCCEDSTALRAATATIEFRDGAAVRKTGARGFHGIDHLKTVVVKGVAERDDAGNLTVVADGVFVRPGR
jgi:hypothetical protein